MRNLQTTLTSALIVSLTVLGLASSAFALAPAGPDDLTVCPAGVDCSPETTKPGDITTCPEDQACGGPETTDPTDPTYPSDKIDDPVPGNPDFTG